MPRRVIFCRYPSCKYEVEVSAGRLPEHCSGCGRKGRWSFVPFKDPEEAQRSYEYELTHNDYWLFLRRLRIAPQ